MNLFKHKKLQTRGCYYLISGLSLLGFYFLLATDFSSILESKRIQAAYPNDWLFFYFFTNGIFWIGSCLTFLGFMAFVILLYYRK